MAAFLGFVIVLSLIAAVVGLLLSIMKATREAGGATCLLALICLFTALYFFESPEDQAAIAAGYADHRDQETAAKQGFTDPEAWKAKKVEDEDEKARQRAALLDERRREADLPPGQRAYARFLKDPADVSRKLVSVELIDQQGGPLKGQLVRVTQLDTGPLDWPAKLFDAANLYQKVAKIVAESGSEVSGLQFIMKGETADQYGQPQQQIAFLLALPMSELKKINWDNFTGWDMLNLSSVDARAMGRYIAREFCKEEQHARYAARFCRNTRR